MTGSQCSCCSAGLMCARRSKFSTSRAAAFCGQIYPQNFSYDAWLVQFNFKPTITSPPLEYHCPFHSTILHWFVTKAHAVAGLRTAGLFRGRTRGTPATYELDCRIFHTQSPFFSGCDTPDPCRSAPGAWTQTPISAWLASVPVVPVLRNDHCNIVSLLRATLNGVASETQNPNPLISSPAFLTTIC